MFKWGTKGKDRISNSYEMIKNLKIYRNMLIRGETLGFGEGEGIAMFFSLSSLSFSKFPVMNVFYIYNEKIIFLSQNQSIINSSNFFC